MLDQEELFNNAVGSNKNVCALNRVRRAFAFAELVHSAV